MPRSRALKVRGVRKSRPARRQMERTGAWKLQLQGLFWARVQVEWSVLGSAAYGNEKKCGAESA